MIRELRFWATLFHSVTVIGWRPGIRGILDVHKTEICQDDRLIFFPYVPGFSISLCLLEGLTAFPQKLWITMCTVWANPAPGRMAKRPALDCVLFMQ